MVNFKIDDVKDGQQIITINILPDISRRKHNQKTKFGQLLEHNMRNIFVGNDIW